MERISEEGEWRRSKRRKTTAQTAAEIVNQWTKSNTNATWIDDVKHIEEVRLYFERSLIPKLILFF
jgi:hypothetical protein